ncbi:MAG: alpha/beta hydrolase [Egibacteraceae bacterium]
MRPVARTLDVDGMELTYGDGGPDDRPTLLLLHGLAARWQVFGPLLPPLLRDYHVIAPDLRGHGQSGRSPDGYRLGDFTADVRGLLAERDEGPALVYGHSLGGWVGLCLAAEAPETVRGLVVADTAIYPEHIDPDFAVSYLADMPITMRSMAKSLQQLDDAVMGSFRAGQLLADYDPDEVLTQIACPMLLLQADPAHDGLMNDADVERARARVPGLRHVRFAGVGHALHIEDAAGVLEVVEPFLKACGGDE